MLASRPPLFRAVLRFPTGLRMEAYRFTLWEAKAFAENELTNHEQPTEPRPVTTRTPGGWTVTSALGVGVIEELA